MRPICCPENSVQKYDSTPSNIPEDHRSQIGKNLSCEVSNFFIIWLRFMSYITNQPINQLTNSMEQSPSSGPNNSSAIQEIPPILWNRKIHYRVHKGHGPHEKIKFRALCALGFIIRISTVENGLWATTFSRSLPHSTSTKYVKCFMWQLNGRVLLWTRIDNGSMSLKKVPFLLCEECLMMEEDGTE